MIPKTTGIIGFSIRYLVQTILLYQAFTECVQNLFRRANEYSFDNRHLLRIEACLITCIATLIVVIKLPQSSLHLFLRLTAFWFSYGQFQRCWKRTLISSHWVPRKHLNSEYISIHSSFMRHAYCIVHIYVALLIFNGWF